VNGPLIHTVGYSNREPDSFLQLLRGHGITAVADVRSSPYSRRSWYCGDGLERLLASAGIRYVFLGEQLGARRAEPECYVDDQAVYEKVAQLPAFNEGITRVLGGAREYRIVLMCGERDPLDCHRGVLVSPKLLYRGASVDHILASGEIENHTKTEKRMIDLSGIDPLFDNSLDQTALLQRSYNERGCQLAYRRDAQG
jgi:uncharacterized protein (DUF488 family)